MSLAGGKLVLDHPAEAVARLTISNPERRNALDHEILEALAEVLPGLDRGIEIRCVVITGAGEIFSAGYDIAGIPEETFATDAEALVAHPFHAAMEAVSAHPYPVLAAINGHCLGGGLELAVRCDLRLCAMSAKLGMPPAKLGLIYGHTGPAKFIDVVGLARTKELFLTGRNLSAPRAMAIGLVHDTVLDAELETAARRAGLRGGRQRAPLDDGEQARDRGPQLLGPPHSGAGARADRAAALVLCLRGLPGGRPSLRREAQARVARALDGSVHREESLARRSSTRWTESSNGPRASFPERSLRRSARPARAAPR